MSPHKSNPSEKHPPRDKYTKLLCYLKNQKHEKFVRFMDAHKEDVNHKYDSPDNGTLLQIACRVSGNSKFVETLIQHNAEINSLNDTFGKAPIHDVVQNDDVKMLQVLVQSGKCNPHVQDKYGNCVLHYAAVRKNIPIVRILKQYLDPDIVAWKLVDLALVDLVNYHTSDQMRKELDSLLQHNTTKKLFALLYERQPNQFIERIKELEIGMGRDFLYDNDGYNNYLQYACKAGYGNVVTTLLAMEIDPNNYWYMDPMNPIMISAFQGYHRILKVLLDYPNISLKSIGKHNVVHCLFYGMFMNRHQPQPPIEEEPCDYQICFDLLCGRVIQRNRVDVNAADEKGYTVLHYAVYLNHKDAIRRLINAGADVCQKNCNGQTPLTLIDPAILEEYLNSCISFNEVHCGDANHIVVFRYNIFTPRTEKLSRKSTNPTTQADPGQKNQIRDHMSEIRPLVAMTRIKELRNLLAHPVTVSFVTLKWHVVKKLFFINAIFYLVFAAILNLHLCLVQPGPAPNVTADNKLISLLTETIHNYTLEAKENPSMEKIIIRPMKYLNHSLEMLQNMHLNTASGNFWPFILKPFVWLLLSMLVCRELFQISVHPRYYVKSFENWLILVSIILTSISLTAPFHNKDLNNIFASITVFVVWLEFLILLGRYPALSTNQEMIKRFSRSFFKFIHWFAWLILAFGFSVYVKFGHNIHHHAQDLFAEPFKWVFKSFILTPGEITEIQIQHFVKAVYLVVILYIAIVLFNILNGLAIVETQSIRSEAELVENTARVKFISHLETIAFAVPDCYFKFYNKMVGDKRGRNCVDKFYSGLHLFPYIFADHTVHVSPNNGNQVLYVTTDENSPHGGSYMVLSRWKIDSRTVENAIKIFEKQVLRNDFDVNYDRMMAELTNQKNTYQMKIDRLEKQIDRLMEENKNAQRLQDQNNQLLKEIMDYVKSKS